MYFRPVAAVGHWPHVAYAKINSDVLQGCVMCGGPCNLSCGHCDAYASYCSEACRSKDRKYHQILCTSSVSPEFRLSSRPGPDYRRVIALPVDGTQPVWEWARFTPTLTSWPPPAAGNLYSGVDINRICTNEHMRFGRGLRRYNILKKKGDGTLDSDPEQPINTAVQRVFKKPGQHMPEFGSVVGGDATMKDLRLIVDLYLTHPDNPCIIDEERHGHGDAAIWPALKLNCKRDMARFRLHTNYEIEHVYVSSAGGSERFQAYVPQVLGLSWVWEYATSTNDTLPESPDGFETNRGFLGLFEPPKDVPAHPYIKPLDHALRYGTVMVMHESGWSLQPEHVETVLKFATAPSAAPARREFTSKGFARYWNEHWGDTNIPSPYLLESRF
ncbi:uncharacterized protein PG998_012968 [Apiospora kogelbergensis]|uniref:uncharacterized protein n=1 Tax=Apiospora kogelbergensis TaxID=1337665 RepID=UPI0031304E4A